MNVPERHRPVAHKWVDGAEVECTPRGLSEWRHCTLPMWAEDYEYRVKPAKPSIDWSHVAKRIVAIATDANQDELCYAAVPKPEKGEWYGPTICGARVFASFEPGDCDWRDSLIVRPGYEAL